MDLAHAQQAAEEAAIGAGNIIREAFRKRKEIQVKGGVDLVTETDKECERFIMSKLQESFPHHRYVGEESSFLKAADHLTDEPTWFIDPLDGTTNFVHGYPFVCVSIGLMVNKEAVVGVVYNPILDELYSARKGAGATLNGSRIHVSSTQSLGEAVVVNNVGASRDRRFLAKTFSRLNLLLSQPIRALRNSGSAAQNMCHVASGVLDAYFEDGFGGPWDVVGGIVVVTEAGGAVSGIRGEPFELSMGKGSIICGNRSLVGQVARVLHAADLRRTLCVAAGYGLAAIAAALAVSATMLKYKQLR